MQSYLDSDDKGFCMFLVTIYLNMSSLEQSHFGTLSERMA